MRIRASRTEDGERVMDIWRAAVDATHDFLSPLHRNEIEQELAQFLPTAPLWLAVDEQDIAIGFMLLDHHHIEALFIDPASRGQGIGRALVTYAVELHGEVSTDVNEQNLEAIGFYDRLHFTPTGRSEQDEQGRPYPLIHLHRANPS